MTCKIVIVGAGNLGSRYLQGLSKVLIPLEIYVVDVSNESLFSARKLWEQVYLQENRHTIKFIRKLNNSIKYFDLAIIATSADVRSDIIKNLSLNFFIKYWIIEKVLAQSIDQIIEIQQSLPASKNVWINNNRRIMSWYNHIKFNLLNDQILSMKVEGGQWGMACNAVHYLDLLAWLGDCELSFVETNFLSGVWQNSKRAGFWEVFGTLVANYSNNISAKLICHEHYLATLIKINTVNYEWLIDESTGIAKRSDGLEINGKIPYQSEITASLVESILLHGFCGLPSLDESAKLHIPFLQSLLLHWNQNMQETKTYVPIT
jgi:hypothetical protein